MGHWQSTIPRVDEENIRKEVKRFPVVMYTKARCPYCIKAKQLLDKENIEYKEHDLDLHERFHPNDHQSYVNGLICVTKQTLVPQIFICGNFIGLFSVFCSV
ncbi:unnamed protein product [Gongylonema pulchrum]|uniref:Glutaredoxin domain-containing protein n=1 Tax=Gongylonema pulchrum TaxID=637853 RepID=A0A183DXB2_9BILA|nr:unnamed protein product [Gongylonema pulchrum]